MCYFVNANCFSLHVQCVVQRECFHAFLDAWFVRVVLLCPFWPWHFSALSFYHLNVDVFRMSNSSVMFFLMWRGRHGTRATFQHWTPNTEHQTPNTKHRTPNIKHKTPNTDHQIPNNEHHKPNNQQHNTQGNLYETLTQNNTTTVHKTTNKPLFLGERKETRK